MPVEAQFDTNPAAASEVRRFVGEVLAGFARLEDILLVASELASNVLVHARTPFQVRIEREVGLVRLEVENRSAILPAVRDLADSHWGLRIVEALGDRWGIESGPNGKIVWVEFTPFTRHPA